MPALRMLGMVILAIFVASLGVIGYSYVRVAISDRDAKEAALKLDASVGLAVTTGNPQVENVRILDGYTMRFGDNQSDNQIIINGYRVPVQGYSMSFDNRCPVLGAGDYSLSITIIENFKILVVERT
ncbi:MAG: hypothetical protein MUO36_01370 [Candidatus Hadarchaeum sp.]|jgi:hypothetical protein|nr:hypothetical protein [Candidatus Hadarchaeum sp.]